MHRGRAMRPTARLLLIAVIVRWCTRALRERPQRSRCQRPAGTRRTGRAGGGAASPCGPGHLPPGSKNMELVGKLKLTDVDGGIADVAAFGKLRVPEQFQPRVRVERRRRDRRPCSGHLATRASRGRSASSRRTRTATWARASTSSAPTRRRSRATSSSTTTRRATPTQFAPRAPRCGTSRTRGARSRCR